MLTTALRSLNLAAAACAAFAAGAVLWLTMQGEAVTVLGWSNGLDVPTVQAVVAPAVEAHVDTSGDLTQLQHAPTMTAAQIDAVLASYGSPAHGQGETFYQLGVQYGINPAVAVAFFIHESSAGTAGAAVQTRSVGNIICAGWRGRCVGRFRAYDTWHDSIEDWYKLIRDEYISEGRTTVAAVIPKYAPATENDVQAYIDAVNGMVTQWAEEKEEKRNTVISSALNCPLARCVVTGYTFNAASHPGVDYGATLNEPVHATIAGRAHVTVTWPCGNGVEVFGADGLSVLTCHLNGFAVADGTTVAAGDVIGYAGQSGLAYGVHTHFEIRRNGVSSDPLGGQ